MSTVDHQLVKLFRQEAGDRIAEQRRIDQVAGAAPMTAEDEWQYARAVIAQILEDYARAEINLGRTPLDAETEESYAAAVHAALLGVLANEIPPSERLITVERALELGLDQFLDLHPNVVAFEERLPNSEGQGTISMAELVRRSLRMNPSRVIVGEVLGDEIFTMLNAMSQGNDGSLSTIHANSSSEVFNRISTYALQANERLPIEVSHMLVAGAVNFVVFVERRNDYASGGSLSRRVTSVREVNGVDGRVLSSEVFIETADGRVVPHAPVTSLDELAAFGYRPSGAWG